MISDPPGSEYRPKSRKPPKIPKIPKIPENPENPRKSRKSPKIPDSAIMRLGGLRLRLPLRHTRYREALRANNAKAHCAYHGRLRQHPGPNYSAKPLHHHSASQDECLACRRHAKLKNHRILIPVLKMYARSVNSLTRYKIRPRSPQKRRLTRIAILRPGIPQNGKRSDDSHSKKITQSHPLKINPLTSHEKTRHNVSYFLPPGAERGKSELFPIFLKKCP